LNYVPVNPHTLRSNQWPNVWALGDAANLPTSKAGAAVHYQMEAAVENMLAVINSREPEGCYDGHANCFVETGFYKGVLIDFNYDIDPLPGTYPLPVLGPFSLLGNTVFNHLGKLFFKWMYWNIVIRGIDIPLPNNLTLSGKHLTAEEKKTYSQILAKGACNV
jgi:sulfide:quinone oxidoreductase